MFSTLLDPAHLPQVLAASVLGGIFLLWLIRFPAVFLFLLPMSLVFGQLVRFSLPGQGGGVLLSDFVLVLVPLVIVVEVATSRWRLTRPRHAVQDTASRYNDVDSGWHRNDVSRRAFLLNATLWLPFLLWSAWLLVWNKENLALSELGVAVSYWVRLALSLLLLPTLLLLLREPKRRRVLEISMAASVVILLALGLVQIIFWPSLVGINGGWDPHIKRLVATWLDPNFFGMFLIMAAAFLAAVAAKTQRWRFLLAAFSALALIELSLTGSRSSLLAFGAALLILTPLALVRISWNKKKIGGLFMFLVTAVFVVVLAIYGLGDRATGLLSRDDTVRLREEALNGVWRLAQENTFIGPGYNGYQFAARGAGLIDSFAIHSRAGADNSWLTLWVTTGIVGTLLFAVPWVYVAGRLLSSWLKNTNPLALAALFSLLALFIHSQFVNSFLYGHLLIALMIMVSLADSYHTIPRHAVLDTASRYNDVDSGWNLPRTAIRGRNDEFL